MRTRDLLRLTSLCFAVALSSASLPAWSDDGHLTVLLKSGASYRGELVERVPGDHLTLKLATGEVKTFKWAELDLSDADEKSTGLHDEASAKSKAAPRSKAEAKSDEGEPAGADDARPTGDDGDAANEEKPKKKRDREIRYTDRSERVAASSRIDEGGGSIVHIESDQGIYLERRIGSMTLTSGFRDIEGSAWARVCMAPCNQALPPGEYRLAGDGLRPETIQLRGGAANIKASLGGKTGFVLGYSSLAIGSGAIIGVALSMALTGSSDPYSGQSYDRTPQYWMLGIGGAFLVVGTIVWVANWNWVSVDGGHESSLALGDTGIRWSPSGFTF